MTALLLAVAAGFGGCANGGAGASANAFAMASADAPMKGIATLLEAFAKLRVERPELELVLVSKPETGGPTERSTLSGTLSFKAVVIASRTR